MEILKKWALSTLRVLNSGARATPSLQARLKNVVQRYNTRGAIHRAQFKTALKPRIHKHWRA
jgi:hypothetical protein